MSGFKILLRIYFLSLKLTFSAKFYFGLVSDSTLGDTPEDDATSQLEEENVKVLFLFYLNKFSDLYILFSFAW